MKKDNVLRKKTQSMWTGDGTIPLAEHMLYELGCFRMSQGRSLKNLRTLLEARDGGVVDLARALLHLHSCTAVI